MFCPKCGMQLNDGAAFCARCGNALGNGRPPQQPAPTPSPYAAQQPPPVIPQQYQAPGQMPQQGGYAPQYSTAPASLAEEKKPNSVLIFIITMVVGLTLIAGFMLFITPGYLMDRDDDDDSSRKSKKDRESSSAVVDSRSDESEPETETTVTTTAPAETTTVTTAPPETTTTEPATTTAETTTTAKKTTANPATEPHNDILDEAWSFSTYERPKFEEFEWCFGQGGLIYEMPANADAITDPLGYTGGWKAMVIYNPSNSAGTFIRELDNIDIDVHEDGTVYLSIDWYLMDIDSSESYSEEDMPDTSFDGYTTPDGIYLSGDAEISIGRLWKQDGKEYALGTLLTSDGLPAYLAMVRP